MALGIVNIYLGLPFSANRRCSRSVGLRSVCRGQLVCGQFVAVSCRGPKNKYVNYLLLKADIDLSIV